MDEIETQLRNANINLYLIAKKYNDINGIIAVDNKGKHTNYTVECIITSDINEYYNNIGKTDNCIKDNMLLLKDCGFVTIYDYDIFSNTLETVVDKSNNLNNLNDY